MDKAIPCWEYMKCGHDRVGGCVVFTYDVGMNCWMLPKTFGTAVAHCSRYKAFVSCQDCPYYQYRHAPEDTATRPTPSDDR